MADVKLKDVDFVVGNLEASGGMKSLTKIPYESLIDKPYTIESYHNATLKKDTPIEPVGNKIAAFPLALSFDVLANDIIEVNSSLSADYVSYNHIGDTFSILYKIGSGEPEVTIPLGSIIGGNNNQETAAGSLYTPFLVTTTGTITITFDIATKVNNARTFLKSHCGILAKIVRK